jgi:hypothetical protein
MERLDNWMSYTFDDSNIRNGAKPNRTSKFKLHFKKGFKYQEMSYYDALLYNARMIKDSFSEPFDVMLSGGIDSEIVVKVNKKEGIKQNLYCVRFENDWNVRDVADAKKIANDVGAKLYIIDWNLRDFFDGGGAIELYNKTFCPVPGRMLRHAWYDFFDNIPVNCEGEPYWKREKLGDYKVKSLWKLYWVEDYFTASIYANTTNRTVIGEWYNYTPEIVMNYHRIPIVQKLLNDEFFGKESCWSTRRTIHLPMFPNITDRSKLTGYEGPDLPPGGKPDFMDKFWRDVVSGTENYEYKFTQQELEHIFD